MGNRSFMSWYHWLIVVIPFGFVCCMAIRCNRYVRSVSDFLVAGRCARRYLLISSGMMGDLSIVTLVAAAEGSYNTGFSVGFWSALLTPIGLLMCFYGWIGYRFRETRAMSAGQFFEMRYSRGLRRLASVLRGTADLIANCIGPAVAVRFLIYMTGIPHRTTLFGVSFQTFPVLLTFLVAAALLMILCGGRMSLLVTDGLQGLITYPVVVILTVYILTEFSWWGEIAPVMADRAPGESFINPYDIQNMRDFNMFGLVVAFFNRIFGGAWVGNGYGTVAKSAHESKMGGVVACFGTGMWGLIPLLLVCAMLVTMNHKDRADTAHEIRHVLSEQVTQEITGGDEELAGKVADAVAAVPVPRHEIAGGPHGVPWLPENPDADPPLSRFEDPERPWPQTGNPDIPYLNAVHETLIREVGDPARANSIFQGFRTAYLQQMMPAVVHKVFPKWIVALLILLCLLLVVSTDDTRIFDTTTTWVQDFILPWFRKAPSPRLHLAIFRCVSVAVGACFWIGSYYLAQMDYISMFVTIVCSLWVAGAGIIVTFGLYWRRGTTAGAYAALVSGGGLSVAGLLVQRYWASSVFPWLAAHGLDGRVRHMLEAASRPFHPWIDWRVADNLWPVKFPVNSVELSFIVSLIALVLYVVISLATCRRPFDLERMLHRGKWADGESVQEAPPAPPSKRRGFLRRAVDYLVGITPEYTRGDRIVAWVAFFKIFVWGFLGTFVFVAIAAKIWNWGIRAWSLKFFITTLCASLFWGTVTTVWFTWGTIRDLGLLFHDLETRTRDDSDNGMVQEEEREG